MAAAARLQIRRLHPRHRSLALRQSAPPEHPPRQNDLLHCFRRDEKVGSSDGVMSDLGAHFQMTQREDCDD